MAGVCGNNEGSERWEHHILKQYSATIGMTMKEGRGKGEAGFIANEGLRLESLYLEIVYLNHTIQAVERCRYILSTYIQKANGVCFKSEPINEARHNLFKALMCTTIHKQ